MGNTRLLQLKSDTWSAPLCSRADELCGRARVQLRDETWQEGWYKDSVLHGFCRKFDRNKQLSWVGMFRNGKPFGKVSVNFLYNDND